MIQALNCDMSALSYGIAKGTSLFQSMETMCAQAGSYTSPCTPTLWTEQVAIASPSCIEMDNIREAEGWKSKRIDWCACLNGLGALKSAMSCGARGASMTIPWKKLSMWAVFQTQCDRQGGLAAYRAKLGSKAEARAMDPSWSLKTYIVSKVVSSVSADPAIMAGWSQDHKYSIAKAAISTLLGASRDITITSFAFTTSKGPGRQLRSGTLSVGFMAVASDTSDAAAVKSSLDNLSSGKGNTALFQAKLIEQSQGAVTVATVLSVDVPQTQQRYEQSCRSDQVLCMGSGECQARCDGIVGCNDRSDERGCSSSGGSAAKSGRKTPKLARWTCKESHGRSINRYQYCDGRPDCCDEGVDDCEGSSDESAKSCRMQRKNLDMMEEQMAKAGMVQKRVVNWVGVEFRAPVQVKCVAITQRQATAVTDFRVFACPSDVVYSETDGVMIMDPSGSCRAMKDLKIKVDKDQVAAAPAQLEGVLGMAVALEATWPSTSGDGKVEENKDCSLQNPMPFPLAQYRFNNLNGTDAGADMILLCYCSQQYTLLGFVEVFLGGVQTPAHDICSEIFSDKLAGLIKLVVGGVAVAVINFVLKAVLMYFVSFERHHSVTERSQSMMLKLFVVQFINTGLLIIVVNLNLHDTFQHIGILKTFKFGEGNFDDISSGWYISVGVSLVFTILSNLAIVTVPGLLLHVSRKCYRRWKARSVLTQGRLNEHYTNPEFQLATKYAQMLNIFFTIVMYCSTVPVLLWIGVLYMSFVYWVDKYLLLRASKIPPSYGPQVSFFIARLLPVAVFLHCVFAMWSFGNQDTFPSDFVFPAMLKTYLSELSKNSNSTTTEETLLNIVDGHSVVTPTFHFWWKIGVRLLDVFRLAPFFAFALAAVLLVYFVVTFLVSVVSYFSWLTAVCTCCCRRKPKTAITAESYEEALAEMKAQRILHTYEMGANPDYRTAWAAIDSQDRRLSRASLEAKEEEAKAEEAKAEADDLQSFFKAGSAWSPR